MSNFDRAVAWFERLLGEPPTFKAHDTEVVWDLAEHRSIYVVLRPERAGFAMVTMFVDDLDGFVESAATRGIHPETQETYVNGVRKATYKDPDGNEVGFGELRPTPATLVGSWARDVDADRLRGERGKVHARGSSPRRLQAISFG